MAVTAALNKAAQTDLELISKAIAGREDGFEELVRRYQRPITSYVFRMLGDYDSALDVTQEVFIKVYNSLSRYSSEYKFSTWLYRVVVNRCLDFQRRPKGTALDAIEEPQDPDGNAEHGLLEAERDQALDAAVARLPERQRAAIALTYTAGLRNAEAAAALDVSVKAFEALLVRAKRELREALTAQGWIQP